MTAETNEQTLDGGAKVIRRTNSSPVVKRSVVVAGHKTSVSLEEEFWVSLKEIATARNLTLSDLVGAIDKARQQSNLSSAIRTFALNHYRDRPSHMHGAQTEGDK